MSISTIHKAERGTILLRLDRQQAIMVLAVGKESLAAPERSQLIFHPYSSSLLSDRSLDQRQYRWTGSCYE